MATMDVIDDTETSSEPIRLSDGTEINVSPDPRLRESELLGRPRSSWSLILVASIATLGVLYLGRDVIVPTIFALMLALLLRPVLRRMKRWHIPNGISALLLVGAVVVLFVCAIGGLAGQAQRWLAEAPTTLRSV